MPETYCEPAVVLNRRPFRGYDYIVSLYTQGRGKIEAVVRGALRSQSRLAAHLEPLTLVDIMVVTGRLSSVGGAVSRNCYPYCKADFDKVIFASHALGIVNRWLREHISDERIFNLITDFLTILNQRTADKDWYEWLSQVFLYKVLDYLGYRLELDTCQKCEQTITGLATFDLRHQGLVCELCMAETRQTPLTIRMRQHLKIYQPQSIKVISTTKVYRKEIISITLFLKLWIGYMNEELTHQRNKN